MMNKEEKQEFIIGSVLGAAFFMTCKSSVFPCLAYCQKGIFLLGHLFSFMNSSSFFSSSGKSKRLMELQHLFQSAL
jgi:hypothetical protein